MEVVETLQKVIDYIEDNLKAEIHAEELAKLSGFSTYHFYHIFRTYVGMPVFAYITKRRLKQIIYEAQGDKSITDLALEYGFDTYPGFYKAFKGEYGCSPKKYLILALAEKPKPVNLTKEARIMLTKTQIKQLLSQWDIDLKNEIISSYEAEGNSRPNNTWSIGEKYIFKTGKNISGLRIHIAISNALKTQGIKVSCPIKTKNSKDFLVKDDRYYVLLNQIKGKALTTEQRYLGNRVEIGNKYGKAIGKLHKVLEVQSDNIEVDADNIYETVLDWALPKTKGIMEQWGVPLPNEFFEDYILGFKNLYPKLIQHIIHRDPNPSNIIFNNDEISGFIDFEISEKNIRIFDPCYCATGILSEAEKVDGGFEKWPELLTAIIQGYDNVCNLTKEEKQAIPYVIYSIQMIFIAWLSKYEEYKNLAMNNRRMLVWLWENSDRCFPNL